MHAELTRGSLEITGLKEQDSILELVGRALDADLPDLITEPDGDDKLTVSIRIPDGDARKVLPGLLELVGWVERVTVDGMMGVWRRAHPGIDEAPERQ